MYTSFENIATSFKSFIAISYCANSDTKCIGSLWDKMTFHDSMNNIVHVFITISSVAPLGLFYNFSCCASLFFACAGDAVVRSIHGGNISALVSSE